MQEWKLRRRCRRMLQQLDVKPPLDVEALCRLLGEQRRRPIQLMPYPLPVPGPFGLWIASASADYVFYQLETSKVHQDHIILHEIGHIMADHQGSESDDAYLERQLPDLSTDVVNKALRRSSYAEKHEREAELVATIILEWASVLDCIDAPASADPSVDRVRSALVDRQGWQ
ncbi:hypothetical protein ACFYZJ_37255 [Streptomyces sp. NPDC001848]|uniref:hypothetical protein n=1 Tax=Streptomyces sp. NPDC001848 TaxID=3364618 RepID=UPI003673BC43